MFRFIPHLPSAAMTPAELRERALALQAWPDSVVADVPWPPHLQAIVDACRDDLAVILAATEADTAAMLEAGAVESLEALRGLLNRQ